MGSKKGDKAQQYLDAVKHPLRRRILRLAVKAPDALSPVQVAARLDEHLSNVSYHIRQLRKAGLLRLVGTRQRRGAMEHFYRPVASAMKHPIIQLMLTEKR